MHCDAAVLFGPPRHGRKCLTGTAIRRNLSTEDSLQKAYPVPIDAAEEMGQALLQMDSLAVRVREYLLAEVTSGRLRQGERINEAELARRLGISRNPIREAVSGLVQKGFLVAKPRRGAELRTFTSKDVDDIFSFRTCVESFALAQAMEVMTLAERAEFPALVNQMFDAAAAEDVVGSQNLDILFHRKICLNSQNKVTLRAFETIDTEVRMMIAAVDLGMETLEESAAAHRPMAMAILAGDREAALEQLRRHIAKTRGFLIHHYDRSDETTGGAAPSAFNERQT